MRDRLIKLEPETLRDSIRLGLQSAVGAAATYLLITWIGLPEVSWGVISALFVIQQSSDGTLSAASGRVLATAVGTMVGLAAVQFIDGGYATLLRLSVSALVVNALARVWPGLRFGVVAAAAIALEPSSQIWDGALDRGISIMLGALVGTVVGFAIWPETARHRSLRAAQAALEDCADLLRVVLDETLDPRERELRPIHRRFLAHVRRAQDMANRARLGRSSRPPLNELVHSLERLWHALVILDRVVQGDRRIDPSWSEEMSSAIHFVQKEACAYLTELVDHLHGRGSLPKVEHLNNMTEAIDRLALSQKDGALPDQALAAGDWLPIHALVFGLREVGRNLREIGQLLE